MNPALDKLYNELLLEADDEEPVEEVSDAERSRRWQEDKQVVIEKLKAVSLRHILKKKRPEKHVSCEFDKFRADTHASCVIHLIL